MVGGVQYEKVDDDGLHVKVGRERRVRLEDVYSNRRARGHTTFGGHDRLPLQSRQSPHPSRPRAAL